VAELERWGWRYTRDYRDPQIVDELRREGFSDTPIRAMQTRQDRFRGSDGRVSLWKVSEELAPHVRSSARQTARRPRMREGKVVSPAGSGAFVTAIILAVTGLVALFSAPVWGLACIAIALLLYFGGMAWDYRRYARSVGARHLELADTAFPSGRGIVVHPAPQELAQAEAWGRAQGQNVILGLVAAGYGTIEGESSMMLVYSPLSWAAFVGSQFGSAPTVSDHESPVSKCLAVEWTVWVPPDGTEAVKAYGVELRQDGRRIVPASTDVAWPPGAQVGHERAAQVTGHFRYSDFALDGVTDVVLVRRGDVHGDLVYRLDLGLIA